MNPKPDSAVSGRAGERGAALITVMLVSLLMLSAGSALVLSTSMSATNTVDSTAEAQAYYAAEAGLNSALSVLRGNVAPRAGLNLPGGTVIGNNFRAANTLALSNLPNDAATIYNPDNNGATYNAFSRLSGWLNYSVGNGALSRVALDAANPGNGSFRIEVDDPADPNRTQLTTNVTYVPQRLRITSYGYGPKGAVKQMQVLVDRTMFQFTPRSTLMMRGAEDCSNMPTFEIGDSNAKEYNGNDASNPPQPPLPVFGMTCPGNAGQATGVVNDSKPTTVTDNPQGKVADVPDADLPPWLIDPDLARGLLVDLAATATGMGRYFKGTQPSDLGSAGDEKFTFVDGDCDLSDGAGLLVVTGTLTMSGNANFNGIILVLGGGTMTRNGGGNGDIMGAVVVARFARTWPPEENDQPHPFLAPTFQTSGGGNSTVRYHSTNVNNAMNALGSRVVGMVEF